MISDCAYFVTCDDRIIRRSELLDLHMLVCNPLEFIRKEGKVITENVSDTELKKWR